MKKLLLLVAVLALSLTLSACKKETELSKELRTVDFEFFYHLVKPNESYKQLAKTYNILINYIYF